MSKLIAILAVLQLGLVMSPVVRAEDAKPAAASVSQVTPAKSDAKEVKADKECDGKSCEGKMCESKSCEGKKAKKSCKHCKNCKMKHHDSKKGTEEATHEHEHEHEGEVEGSGHH